MISLPFNILSRFVIAFLPRSKHLLISWLLSPSAVILEPKKVKPVTVPMFPCPAICLEVMGAAAIIFVFECWVLGQLFHSLLSPSSRGSLVPLWLVPIRMMSSAYLRLLIFLSAVLIAHRASFSLVFCVMYFVYRLNKQGDNIQPWHTPDFEPVYCCMSGSNCCFLTCIQISQEVGKVVWYSHLFKIFLQFVVIQSKALA